ncbi:serine protease Do [Mobilisporobacter senegalensis]|uniref:Serine protease Do n=1 Tax=Mobilisporobacter senegalensis TaxID=1329262 RepID=A0A3N1XVX1_9FIRM|nr:trypsin-like peptidase domain-containing protein [Mobilisporobacter senegalensis]ROR30351.1 serine protease Do [Mobilisporobacter senegalensis]
MKHIKRLIISLLFIVTLNCVPISSPIANYDQIEAASIKLNKTKITLYVGKTDTLKVNTTNSKVTWKSSNGKVAKVSSQGVVTGIKSGTAKITATIGSRQIYCNVTVKDKKLTAEKVYEQCVAATVQINTSDGLGTGFFIDQGKIVTNYHVIAGASNINVQTLSGKIYEKVTILGYDEALDIAVLKISSKNKVLKLNSHGIKVGETVYTIGSSKGFSNTFTNGIIASINRKIENVNYIQTNAALSSGNSGGPLLNSYGEVIGINSMQYQDGQNLNFAININQINKVSTKKSLTEIEFWKKSISEYSNLFVMEDESLSSKISTSQEFGFENKVYGTMKPDETDYYKFTLSITREIGFAGLPLTIKEGDQKNISFNIVDHNGEPISGYTMEYDDYYMGYYGSVSLPAGTYYIMVKSNDKYKDYEIPYGLLIYMFDDEVGVG